MTVLALCFRLPRLGDASAGRRSGLGGPIAYAAYDTGVGAAVIGTLVLWATGGMDVYADLARALFRWGGSVIP